MNFGNTMLPLIQFFCCALLATMSEFIQRTECIDPPNGIVDIWKTRGPDGKEGDDGMMIITIQPAKLWYEKLIQLIQATKINEAATKLDTTSIINQAAIGRMQNIATKEERPAFHATRNQTYDKNKTFVPYDNITLNVGNGLNGNTGLFTAPQKGIYFISFGALKLWNTVRVYVELKHNNNVVVTRQVSGDQSDPFTHKQWINLNLQSTLLMEAGDTVGVYLNDGVLHDTDPSLAWPQPDADLIMAIDRKPITTRNTFFTGFILQML